jgi:DNA modification methylase
MVAVLEVTYVILQGNCLDVLKTIPSNLIQTCVTSPPYFGLRDYGAAGQLGLEATPQAYVEQMVQVFREVRRTLRDDGTLWLNLGDSYARAAEKGGSGPNGKNEYRWGYGEAKSRIKDQCSKQASNRAADIDGVARHLTVGSSDGAVGRADRPGSRSIGDGLKPKDLIGIPWRVAFALQEDGWYLRQWHPWLKRNAMPESTKDRPTVACEIMFLLTKSEKCFYDYEAVKQVRTSDEDANGFRGGAYTGGNIDNATLGKRTAVGNKRVDKQRGHSRRHAGFNDRWDSMERSEQRLTRAFRNSDFFFSSLTFPHGAIGNGEELLAFDVATRPYKEAHFATFPAALIEPCILAGAPAGKLVLDPFGGAGTTALVSESLGRHSISIELNPEYVTMARARVETARIKSANQPLDSPTRF